MHYLAVGGAKVENIHLLHVAVTVMNKERSLTEGMAEWERIRVGRNLVK